MAINMLRRHWLAVLCMVTANGGGSAFVLCV